MNELEKNTMWSDLGQTMLDAVPSVQRLAELASDLYVELDVGKVADEAKDSLSNLRAEWRDTMQRIRDKYGDSARDAYKSGKVKKH